ncbi:MAG: FGGY-family carbohydrate kinase [Deltaproteobacteria bacterium]|nr:FGGY-family carbohydrate kinase [Deltaproteobacteria bacterium]
MKDLILAVDCGTQSLKSALIDQEGRFVRMNQSSYPDFISPSPGYFEQKPEVYYETLIKSIDMLDLQVKDMAERIAGVVITTMRDTLVVLDELGNPLRNAIIWMDNRKAFPPYKPNFIIKTGAKIIGMHEVLQKVQMDGKTNWIMQNEPELWEKTEHILLLSGYLNYRLCGVFTDSTASQVGHIPFNYKKQRWSKSGERNLEMFPVPENTLPKLVFPSEKIGEITAKASKETGIPFSTPVYAAASDKGCETLALSVHGRKNASMSLGTTATVQTTTHRYVEIEKFMPSYPAAIPGYFNPEVEIFRGFWMISWFKKEFGHPEINASEVSNIRIEEALDAHLENIPAGSMGLMMLPFWRPPLLEPSAKGAFLGFGEVHDRRYLYRAIVEGISYGLRHGLEKIQKKTGNNDFIAVAGGGSRSHRVCSILGDICGMPIKMPENHELSLLGAAICGFVGASIHTDYNAAVDSMVRFSDTLDPDYVIHEQYSEYFNEVYLKAVKTLLPLSESIRKISNYPEVISKNNSDE